MSIPPTNKLPINKPPTDPSDPISDAVFNVPYNPFSFNITLWDCVEVKDGQRYVIVRRQGGGFIGVNGITGHRTVIVESDVVMLILNPPDRHTERWLLERLKETKTSE